MSAFFRNLLVYQIGFFIIAILASIVGGTWSNYISSDNHQKRYKNLKIATLSSFVSILLVAGWILFMLTRMPAESMDAMDAMDAMNAFQNGHP